MAGTENDEPVAVGTTAVAVELVELFADQPFSPGGFTIRMPPAGILGGVETAPADPPDTATEGGTDA